MCFYNNIFQHLYSHIKTYLKCTLLQYTIKITLSICLNILDHLDSHSIYMFHANSFDIIHHYLIKILLSLEIMYIIISSVETNNWSISWQCCSCKHIVKQVTHLIYMWHVVSNSGQHSPTQNIFKIVFPQPSPHTHPKKIHLYGNLESYLLLL